MPPDVTAGISVDRGHGAGMAKPWGSRSSPADIASRFQASALCVHRVCSRTIGVLAGMRVTIVAVRSSAMCLRVRCSAWGRRVQPLEATGQIGVACFHYSINCGTGGSLLGKKDRLPS